MVDDVYTTGATIREMFRILEKAEPKTMNGLIFAKYESQENMKKWFEEDLLNKSL
nr:hypothetical protein [endosymbiont 'TC1' of Trimyema compressum]